MTVDVRLDDTWLSTVGGWGDLEVTHGRNGPTKISWSMVLRDGDRPAALARGAVTKLYVGPGLNSSGVMAEPDWDAGTFTVQGIARAGEGAECLNALGAITSKPNTALDQARARGVVPWVRGADFGNTDISGPEGEAGVDDPRPGKLNELLNARSVEQGDTWYAAADGLFTHYVEDESTPDWLILPGVAHLGVASQNITDRVFLIYRDSTAGRDRHVSYPDATPSNGVEQRASVVHQGPMSAARALAIATGMYRNALAGRTGWTNGIEVGYGQVLTLGGQVADLSEIRGGQTVCALDTPDPRGVGRNLNLVLDEVRWMPGRDRTTDLAQLNPVGLVARTWEQVMEQANARAES